MSDEQDFWPLRKFAILDAGERGLGMYLETQRTLEHGAPATIGCLLTADQGRDFLRELAKALEQKYPESRH